MQFKTFLAKLNVRIGEYENRVSLLLVANSLSAANELLDSAAALYYGEGDEAQEDGGYYSNGGEVHVSAYSVQEIGLATFLELKSHLTVRRAPNVPLPGPEHLQDDLSCAAQALLNALRTKHPELTQSHVLHALASSWGEKNWQVLKAKLSGQASPAQATSALWAAVEKAAWAVVHQADNSGCSEDLTVTSQAAVEQLEAVLLKLQAPAQING